MRAIFFSGMAAILLTQAVSASVAVWNDGSGKDDLGGRILIRSEIREEDFGAFAKVADRLRRTPRNPIELVEVELDTPGGNVMEAIQIGRIVRRS